MLTNVSSADYLITGDSVKEKENVQGVEKKASQVNPYTKSSELNDSLEISDQAKSLFQREKDVGFFTRMVLDSTLTSNESEKIMQLIQEGEFIDNQELAEALQNDDDLLRYLFG